MIYDKIIKKLMQWKSISTGLEGNPKIKWKKVIKRFKNYENE
jgi:hypothetical protein